MNELTVNGSFRYTDYDSYGSDTTYKIGLVYSPVELGLAACHRRHVVPCAGAVRAVPGRDQRLPEPGWRPLQQLRRDPGHEPGALRELRG